MQNVTEALLEMRLADISMELLRHSQVCQVCSGSNVAAMTHRIARLGS